MGFVGGANGFYFNAAYTEKYEKLIINTMNNFCLASLTFMEICGTHTESIHRYGLDTLLAPGIKLISGPGCPVCVTPVSAIDRIIALSKIPDICLAVFGDMVHVKGSAESLADTRVRGADIRVITSPLDAVNMAGDSNKTVVYWGIGFETTAPATAVAIQLAKERNLDNFLVYSSHKTMPYAIKYLFTNKSLRIDGLICPGHVATIIGYNLFEGLPKPAVIAGFTPVEILKAVYMLVKQIAEGNCLLQNAYKRSVTADGNLMAKAAISDVFSLRDDDWRGLGIIPSSGLQINKHYQAFDCEVVFAEYLSRIIPVKLNSSCCCEQVICGELQPEDCTLFLSECSPDNPIGACMVSREGVCGIKARYKK